MHERIVFVWKKLWDICLTFVLNCNVCDLRKYNREEWSHPRRDLHVNKFLFYFESST